MPACGRPGFPGMKFMTHVNHGEMEVGGGTKPQKGPKPLLRWYSGMQVAEAAFRGLHLFASEVILLSFPPLLPFLPETSAPHLAPK